MEFKVREYEQMMLEWYIYIACTCEIIHSISYSICEIVSNSTLFCKNNYSATFNSKLLNPTIFSSRCQREAREEKNPSEE